MLNRRNFLETSTVVSLSPVLPVAFTRGAQAAGAQPDSRTLVVVQLDGGNDGLNTVIPFRDDGYERSRKKLRLSKDKLHQLHDDIGLHPNMRAAKELYDDGRLAIVQGVGYPNPDRSHFRSMKIWQTASLDDADHDGYGWLGRALDRPHRLGAAATLGSAVYVGEQETPVALWGRRSGVTTLSPGEDLGLRLRPVPRNEPLPDGGSSLSAFVRQQTLAAISASDEFEPYRNSSGNKGNDYPDTGLGSRLRLVSQLLKSGSNARVYYTSQGGYDTHSTQLYKHSRLLREFSDAVKAFLDDLKSAGLGDRVLLLAFSEFGRRVKENDSQGTDHGTAGPVFLAGDAVRGGLHGSAPDLSDLDQGDLKTHIDFRQVYATVLADWLGVDARSVLGGTFESLALVRPT